MSQLKHFFLFALLFCFSSAHAASFILQAEGYGEDIQQAKASAITNLSQQVIAKVESEFTSDVAVSNDEVNKNIRTQKRVTSDILFKNVKYVNERRDANGIRIIAGLDRQAVEDTVSFMREKLQADFDLLNFEQQQEALVISQQLSALLYSISPAALMDTESLSKWTEERRVELLKRMNQGRLVFVSEVANYQVRVDGNEVRSGDFFPRGSYTFIASAEGYRDVSGRFSVSPGRTVKIKLPFIDEVAGQQVVLAVHDGNEELRKQAQETLAGLGINTATKASQRVDLTFSDDANEVDGFIVHNLKVKMIAYKGSNQIKKITAKKKLTLSGENPQKVLSTQKRLVHKGLMALMARIDLHDYFSQK